MRELPRMQICGPMALVHATPESLWRAPSPEASDDEVKSAYASLDQPIVLYAHIHRPYVRDGMARTVANTGSVGLPYDGDRRAAYLLLDEFKPSIRRVEYDIDKELQMLLDCRLPHADWIAKTIASGYPQMP